MTTIVTKNGSGAPLASDLVQGELAVDLTNKRLYTEDSGGTVIEVGSNPTSLTTGTFTSTGIDDNATSTAITIDSSQNVGIGTASPSTILHTQGTSGTEVISGVTTNTVAKFEANGNDGGHLTINGAGSSTTGVTTLLNRVNGGDLAFAVRTSSTNTEAMRIDSSGNVGIGESDPDDLLHLTSGAPAIRIEDTSVAGEYTRILQNGGGFFIQVDEGNVNAGSYFRIDVDGDEAMRIDSSGNLLVGKTSTALSAAGFLVDAGRGDFSNTGRALRLNRLSGNGTIIEFKANTSDAGSIQATAGGTPAFASASDIRLKDNVTEHESELSNIMSLRPVRWDWKDTTLGSGEGFVAQELEQTAWSDLVSEGDDGYKQVSGLGAVETRLIKALQEAVTRIEALEAEVAALKGAN